MSHQPRPLRHRGASAAGRLATKASILFGVAFMPVACASHCHHSRHTVCLKRIGDDALTMRLEQSIWKGIGSSNDFAVGDCSTNDSLTVILQQVQWRRVGSRIEATPAAEVSGGGLTRPMTVRAHCWDEELADCSDAIIKELRVLMKGQ
jgi:hypothetical protein